MFFLTNKWCCTFLDIVGGMNSGIHFRLTYQTVDAHAFGGALACKGNKSDLLIIPQVILPVYAHGNHKWHYVCLTVGSVLPLFGKAFRETLLMSIREPDIFIYSVRNLIGLVVWISYLISENIVTRQYCKKHYNIIPVDRAD